MTDNMIGLHLDMAYNQIMKADHAFSTRSIGDMPEHELGTYLTMLGTHMSRLNLLLSSIRYCLPKGDNGDTTDDTQQITDAQFDISRASQVLTRLGQDLTSTDTNGATP